MTETKFGNPVIQESVIKLLKETGMPVSVDFVARKLGVGWGTARAILLDLAVQGRIRMVKTTKSLIFSTRKEAET